MNDYDEKITAAGDIDLQLLGIGRNGHIGFNEPVTPFDSPTHIAQLTELTREDNSRFFEGGIDEVPQLAVTQGIGTILQSRMPSSACKKKQITMMRRVLTASYTPHLQPQYSCAPTTTHI